ncbi:MAG: polysaccharide deacetylase family protein, partial [Campylobacteraceae bacterium]|nr:polysaccharide deacetylase family protein [Campylobacteraceae bacterium]
EMKILCKKTPLPIALDEELIGIFSIKEKEEEILKSKEILESRFGIECKTFSYPFGIYKKGDEELVKKCGFIGTVTTETRRVDLQTDSMFLLPRINIKDEYFKFIYKMRKF